MAAFGRSIHPPSETSRSLISIGWFGAQIICSTGLCSSSHALAVPLAHYPEKIRGYGHVKLASVNKVAPEASARREAFVAGLPRIAEAAE